MYDFSSGSDDDDSDGGSKQAHKRAKYEHIWSMGDPIPHAGPSSSSSAPPHLHGGHHRDRDRDRDGREHRDRDREHGHHHHPNPPPVGSRPSFFDANLLPHARHIEPWYHSKFAPLPRAVLQGIRTINPLEMPVRAAYDEALLNFLKDLPADVAEVSAFAPEAYAALAKCVSKGDEGAVSPSLRAWTMIHHARSGSRKYNLVLVPKEAYYAVGREREERLRAEFMAEVDGEAFPARISSSYASGVSAYGAGAAAGVGGSSSVKPPANPGPPPASIAGSASGSGSGSSGAATSAAVVTGKEKEKEREREGLDAFLRIPVLPQIYDVLIYAHKKHGSSTATLAQAREGGLVSLFFSFCSYESCEREC